jgi:hypothetical protein
MALLFLNPNKETYMRCLILFTFALSLLSTACERDVPSNPEDAGIVQPPRDGGLATDGGANPDARTPRPGAGPLFPANRRLHVWHPDLPRRRCYEFSAIHNHRFSFRSTVLVGVQVNRRYNVLKSDDGLYDMVSHDGPRLASGSRASFVDGRCDVFAFKDERYRPGQSYTMSALAYHETPNSGVVVTLMEKLEEGTVHAHSIIRRGNEFDQSFDRFQLSDAKLWAIVADALDHADAV